MRHGAITMEAASVSRFQRLGNYGIWIGAALLLCALPFGFRSGTSLTVMSLMGIAVIFALSYNMLLGQTGMLSFGHAVYYGLGAYFTVHVINAVAAARLPIPLFVMPLIGGAAGLVFAMIFGWVSTKRSGTAFAMISLGLAELIGSSSLILRSFFGGEEGVNINRTKLLPVFGWNFGPQIQVYYLIAAWCLITALLMYGVTRTPFGRMCNAVRDNPQRVQFIGYNPQIIRYMAFCLSGLFAGIAGALAAINFELANSAVFSAALSGTVLLATFIGGAGHFVGPILGGVLVSYLQNMLSDITDIWQLYFGLMFIAVVLFAPGGLAGIIMMHRPLLKAGTLWRLVPAYLGALLPTLVMVAGLVLTIETVAHLTKGPGGFAMQLFGLSLDARSWQAWALALAPLALGLAAMRLTIPNAARAWDLAIAGAREKGIAA
ncbi:amino acid/amide ABC transporter membrane protein 2, HAAT family [Rhizobiales bacterium GAS191]|jgi:branched-chain amino acid transport system permease protein|nr:amino acid/amide ABC transporter membrane protein 2, HAAT family [Rhizobiales bacterium GAS191]